VLKLHVPAVAVGCWVMYASLRNQLNMQCVEGASMKLPIQAGNT
jgi:hypothetical protein